MFTIDNYLQEQSFRYDPVNGIRCLGRREDDLCKMQEIWDYCRSNQETLQCDLNIFYDMEVEPGISLCDWVFSNEGTGDQDVRNLLLYMIDSIREYEGNGDGEIEISLGSYENCVSTVDEYKDKRRKFLAELTDVGQFTEFMGSCFQNTAFSEDILTAMKRIPKFRDCTKQIVFNLSLLNDHAIEIYEKYNCDGAMAMKELSVRAAECTGDPAHKAYLKFPFSYTEEKDGGQRQYMIKQVECSPHMKLIRPDSNLRIYFFWFDHDIGDGKKVLIGHIGGHPY